MSCCESATQTSPGEEAYAAPDGASISVTVLNGVESSLKRHAMLVSEESIYQAFMLLNTAFSEERSLADLCVDMTWAVMLNA